MNEAIQNLLVEMRSAQDFGEGAQVALAAAMDATRAALISRGFENSHVTRGIVHVRSDGGYDRIAVRLGDGVHGAKGASITPSATAWRWVSRASSPVAVDVQVGMVLVGSADAGVGSSPFAGMDSHESRARLLERETTHLLVLPLRTSASAPHGMITIETTSRATVGRSEPWSACAQVSQLLADIAAPFLLSLPTPREGATPNELLPVIGPTMRPLIELLGLFARQDETLILTGPTGVGKSRLARWAHDQSSRRARTFEALDLVAVPADLQLAELFGWKRGAFTGAVRDTSGALTRAEGGTLFIDEIDKLSLTAQAGLLKLIEDRTYRVLGDGATDRKLDVRILVGSSSNLSNAVDQGTFRADLFYRIHVLPIAIPALRERRDEIEAWGHYMLARRHTVAGTARLSSDAARQLTLCDWPGNLRQLDNIVRRAYAIASMACGHGDVTVRGVDMERALGLEGARPAPTLIQRFRETARAYVDEAEARSLRGATLDLDGADALRGFILEEATTRTGDRAAALKLLGKSQIVAQRNHFKLYKIEQQRVEQFRADVADTDGTPSDGEPVVSTAS